MTSNLFHLTFEMCNPHVRARSILDTNEICGTSFNYYYKHMDFTILKSVLISSTTKIQSVESFSDRMNVVYDILDKAFPKTSEMAALYGPITSLGNFMSRTEIEPLLYAIKKSADTEEQFLITDEDLNSILQRIYELAK